jgi:hypothetical protein
MKWPKSKITGNRGLLYVKQVVVEHGDIFREIHLEEDVGIDAVIEFVKDNEALGRLLAIQIKSGDSYLASEQDKFIVPVDEARLAVSTLGYCIAHRKWSFYPDEDLMNYTRHLCRDFGKSHVCRLLELVDDGDFGPMSLGEACLDCMSAMWAPDGERVFREVVVDTQITIQARANALVWFYGGDWNALLAESASLQEDGLGEIVTWVMADR